MLQNVTPQTAPSTLWWDVLTPGQGTVISGGLTLLAAIIGVLLGWWLLSGKVKDLKGAVEESEALLRQHNQTVSQLLSEIINKVEEIDSQFTSTAESLGQLRGAVGDLQSESVPDNATENEIGFREEIRSSWESIRDSLERIAADPQIDGRTRARYNRLDRRRYGDLVEALAQDARLGDSAESYRQAVNLWQQYRNGRRIATSEDNQRMKALRNKVVPT